MNYPLLREKFLDAYLAAIPLIILNVVWFVTSLPLVTASPALAGLFYATNRLAHGRSAGWRTFVEGFRLYFWRSWLWGLMNVAIALILASNLFYYSLTQAAWTLAARAILVVLAVLWLALQLHAFPLLIEQEQPRFSLALRNSMVILLKRPLYSLGTALLIAIIALGSTFIVQPAWLFITASLCAYLANRATLNSIAKITGKPTGDSLDRARPAR